jgi:hypothetical protein
VPYSAPSPRRAAPRRAAPHRARRAHPPAAPPRSAVQVYKIPARAAAGGHKSGDWLVADKLADCRLRVLGRADLVECRLEETDSGELFAT